MELVDGVYSDPEQRADISSWQDILQDDILDQPDTREILLYRTFYYFLEKLMDQSGQDFSQNVPADVIRLFADRFSWVKEEPALASQYGASQTRLLIRHAYARPDKMRNGPLHAGNSRKRKYILSIIGILLPAAVLVYLIASSLVIYRNTMNGAGIPYYACRLLFTDRASQSDYMQCHSQAEGNDDKAQLFFGLAQLFSVKFPKDPDAAIDWLTRAANQSNRRALYMLGAVHGEAIKLGEQYVKDTDFDKAEYWLTRAADAGEKHADTHLASLYIIRDSGLDDHKPARDRLMRAAAAEQTDAYLAMAYLELYGLASNTDYDLAKKWLDLYAGTDIPDGSNEAAWLLATSPDSNFRDGRQAAKYIEFLLEEPAHPNMYMYLDTIAAVHAVQGDFSAAVDFQNQAINLLKTQAGDIYRENIGDFQKRLSLFQDQKIWIEEMTVTYLQDRFKGIKNRIISHELRDLLLNTE